MEGAQKRFSKLYYNILIKANLKLHYIAAYSGGYPFSISGDIRSVPS